MNKKIIMYVVIAVALLAVATGGTILTLSLIKNNNDAKAKTVITKDSAKALQDKAEEARKNNDTAKAKTLLLEAQQQYEELPKTDSTTAAKVDVEAQLFLLEHSGTAQ